MAISQWLVGFMEGEGSFYVTSRKDIHAGRVYHYLRAALGFTTTDKDVAQRASDSLGHTLYGSYADRRRPTNKPQYQCRVEGKSAINLMRALHRHMGRRRKAQIMAVLKTVPEGCRRIRKEAK